MVCPSLSFLSPHALDCVHTTLGGSLCPGRYLTFSWSVLMISVSLRPFTVSSNTHMLTVFSKVEWRAALAPTILAMAEPLWTQAFSLELTASSYFPFQANLAAQGERRPPPSQYGSLAQYKFQMVLQITTKTYNNLFLALIPTLFIQICADRQADKHTNAGESILGGGKEFKNPVQRVYHSKHLSNAPTWTEVMICSLG